MEAATCKFPDWAPTSVIDYYAEQGIQRLFEWQAKVLFEADRNSDKNLVFTAPTSAGKSIVAELLGWRVASAGRKVLFVLPYISVAREKLHQVQKCWRRDDLAVSGFIGPQASNPNEWVGAVCTIEKAASLTNRALSEDWLDEIGMVVVDELHMVFDSSRGAHIEHMLAKILLWNKTAENKIKIVGMSATVPELKRIGDWLDAPVFEADFRPVQLNNHTIIGLEMRNLKDQVIREFQYDPLLTLAEESFQQNYQTLIMISSKMDAERVAIDISKKLHELKKVDGSIMERLKERLPGLLFTKHGLERNGCKDKNLIGTLAWGVAFHHAGLTLEERECIELGFREKSIIILVATSTLASGVNLPAERVIIKAQTRGPSALTSLSYRQMVGRAGRTGYATRGESYLIVKACDREAVEKIINSPIDNSFKRRPRESERTNLGRFILEGVATGLTTTRSQILDLCSFLLHDSNRIQLCDIAIDTLLQNSFISSDEEVLSPTQLGRAAIASSLPPEAALAIFEDLNVASRSIALDTELHMLYLVTPINVSVWQECDWHHLFALFSRLPPDHRRIAKLVGVSEKFILDQLQGRRDEGRLQIHTRFFSALALFDMINEMSIYEVSHKYRITRGCLQTLQSQSATYAAMIVAFCVRLGWTYLKALLDGFAMRLLFGIRSELSELVTVEGIDGQRARILHEKGITCLSHLSACEISKLSHYLTLAVPYSSSNSNDGLGEWLFGEPRMKIDEAARILKERARIMLQRRIRELGIAVELPKEEPKKELKEEPKEQEFQESCDSGLPDSCAESVEEENEEKNMEEMTKSVTELSILSEEEDTMEDVKLEFNMEVMENDEEVEETILECLETSLMKLRAPKDEKFLRRLSLTFSPTARRKSALNTSICDDSFDRPVPGCVPLVFRTPKRELTPQSQYQFDDSFDRPVPGSVPFVRVKRESIIKAEAISPNVSINSGNRSYDVFDTPPIKEEKPRIGLKHGRIDDIVDSPLATVASSPLLKHPKMDPDKFWLEDVCHDQDCWWKWVKSATYSLYCSIVLAADGSGVAVNTDRGATFLPLRDVFDGVDSSLNQYLFGSLKKCVIPLETRLEWLKFLLQSVPAYFSSMEVAFLLFDKFEIQISNVKVLKVMAHLNHLINCDDENHPDSPLFPMLFGRCSDWNLNFDIREVYSESRSVHRAAVEAFALRRIFEELERSAIASSSEQSVHLEMASCQTVLNMTYSGISFDHSSCSVLIRSFRQRIEILEDEIARLAHGKVNLDSSHDVAKVLFNRLGLVYPETAGCKPKQQHLPTNKTILEQMKEQHAVVGKILDYRHLHHTVTQCLVPLGKHKTRIHCWFEMCTATGRIMTISPNLQNVPKRVSNDGNSVRNLFTASPGKLLIGADYKQLELRVLAHLSNDPTLVNLISQDRDLFAELSFEWNFPRDAVKQLCYGLIYGMGAKSLAELTKMRVEEAEKMIKSFFETFPKVRSFINETKERAAKDEFVETILGRKRMITIGSTGEERARMERVAVNYTIQGTASEIFKTAMMSIDKKIVGYNSRIVLTIHDEVLVECPLCHVTTVSDIIRDCMQNSLSDLLRVPMSVSLKTGLTWAELK